MIIEDNNFVIHGPPAHEPIPKISLGLLVYNSLHKNYDKPQAFVDAGTSDSISYKELLGRTCSLATSLLKQGYGKDTIVSVSSENSINFYIPVISALYIGAVVYPINHNYTPEELTHCLNICKPRIVFCSKAVSQKYIQIKQQLTYIDRIIIIDSDSTITGSETLNEFTRDTTLYTFPVADVDAKTQTAFVMCSSGTTGLPKAVMQTHFNIMARFMQNMDPQYLSIEQSFLGILPFFHSYGFVTTIFALILGQKVVVIKRFQEELFLRTIQDHKIVSLALAPPLVVLLAKSPLVDRYDLSSVKEVTCGAAPLSKQTEETVKKRLNIKTIRQGYGLTETILGVIRTPIDKEKHGSSGKVVGYISCKIRDPDTGKSLGPHQIGELCIKGPMVMKGYYKNEEATRNSFTSDGWLLTGDLAYYDEDEYFFIVDRLKELIKYKGFQVAPAELESILLNHPKIKDVAVIGLPDEEAGELPLAFVVKNSNSLSEKEVIDYVAGKVSSQKRLRGGVIFISEIPKNPSGKILRKNLRQTLNKSKL